MHYDMHCDMLDLIPTVGLSACNVHCRFAALPTAQSTVFQLCDLSAATMQMLLSKLQTQDVCSPTTGVQPLMY